MVVYSIYWTKNQNYQNKVLNILLLKFINVGKAILGLPWLELQDSKLIEKYEMMKALWLGILQEPYVTRL